MKKHVNIKVYNQEQLVTEKVVLTKNGKTTVIDASAYAHYMFTDVENKTAPEHVITQRIGEDMHVFFTQKGKDADLVIKGFFNKQLDGKQALIGQAENGEYYNYIPDTGLVENYSTQLADGAIAGTALGGEPTTLLSTFTPAAFNPIPWLAGLGAAGVAAALLLRKEKKPDPIEPIDPPKSVTIADGDGIIRSRQIDGQDKVEVTVELPKTTKENYIVDVNGVEVVVTKENITDGKVKVALPVPKDGEKLEVVAKIKSPENRESDPANDDATVHSKGPDIKVEIVKVTEDDVVNAKESKKDVPVEVKVTGEFSVGDTVILTVNDQPFKGKITDVNGKVTIDVPADDVVADNKITAKITSADKYGNETTVTDKKDYVVDTKAPEIAIKITKITEDDVINVKEAQEKLPVTAKVTGEFSIGDEVELNVNGKKFTAKITNKDGVVTFDVPGSDLVADNKIKASITSTDENGNATTATDTKEQAVDTQVPAELTVTIVEDKNNDGFIKRDEISKDNNVADKITAKIAFDADKAKKGDVLVVTDKTDPANPIAKKVVLTKEQVEAGVVLVPFNKPAEGSNIIVDAQITDTAGNTSNIGKATAKLDTSDLANGTLKVAIIDDKNNNELISIEELGLDGIQVQVTLPSNVDINDALTITGTGNAAQTVTVTPVDIAKGVVNVSFINPGDGVEFVTTAQVKDAAGNQSEVVKDKATLQLAKPDAPTVVITNDSMPSKGGDGFINKTEVGDKVTVKITVPKSTEAGAKILVTDNTGTNLEPVVVTKEILENGVEVRVNNPAEGKKVIVSAVIEDKAGNISSRGSDFSTLDTSDLQTGLTVEILEDINNDGLIQSNELKNKVDVKVTLPKGASVGDVVTVEASGNTAQTVTLRKADIDAGSVQVAFNGLSDKATFETKATITDTALNTGTSNTDTAVMDLQASGKPTVTINADSNPKDGLLNKAELGNSNELTVTVKLPTPSPFIGDKVNLDTNGNGKPNDFVTLKATDIQNGFVTFTIPRPVENTKVTAEAWVENQQGKSGEKGSATATIDTTPTSAPTVEIVSDENNDGFVNKAEADKLTNNEVAVKVTFDATDVSVGETVTVTSNTGTKVVLENLTQDQIKNGVVVKVAKPVEGAVVTAEAKITDKAGNVSEAGKDQAKFDTSDLANDTLSISIVDDKDNNELISKDELGTNGIQVSVALPANAKEGDTITITGTGNADKVIVLTDVSKPVQVTFDKVPASGAPFTATAQVKDAAGNATAVVKDTATIDTVAYQAPVVAITTDADNNGFINASEKGDTVAVEVTLPSGIEKGDKLTVTDNAGNTKEVTLEANQTTANVTFPNPAEGKAIEVTATVTDLAGNVSKLSNKDTATFDTSNLSDGLAITINDDQDNNELISKAELGTDGIQVTVDLPAGAVANDTLTITTSTGSKTVTLKDTDISAKKVSVTFTSPIDGSEFKASAKVSDEAGNVSNTVTDKATLQLAAAGAPTVIITEAKGDKYINAQELDGDVNVTVKVPTGNDAPVAGSVLIITTPNGTVLPPVAINDAITKDGHTFEIPVEQFQEGSEKKVTAVIKTPAGNISPEGEASATLDTSNLTEGLAITIVDDANNDKLISKAELANDNIQVEVALPVNAKAGDTLVVTGTPNQTQTITLKDTDISAKKVAVTFLPTEGADFVATAKVTDTAGNQSAVVKDNAVVDTIATGKPALTIVNDKAPIDGYINKAEKGDMVEVLVKLPSNVKAGDVLTITDNTGTNLTPITLTEGQTEVTVKVNNPSEGSEVVVTAQITDKAGNTSEVSEPAKAILDTSDLKTGLEVVISEDANNDGVISQPELNGLINVRVYLPSNAANGDTIKLTANGSPDQQITLGQGTTGVIKTDSKGTYVETEFNALSDNSELTVNATITDIAKNTASAKDTATMDLSAPGKPVVVIAEANGDEYINKEELQGDINITVTLPGTAVAGDTLYIDWNNDGKADDKKVLEVSDITANKVDFAMPSAGIKTGDVVKADAWVKDASGNNSEKGTSQATVDITAPTAPTAKLPEDAANDTGTSATDNLTNNTTPAITGTAEAGSTVTVVVDGQTLGPVTADDSGNWKVQPTKALSEGEHTPKVTSVDVAGNKTTANGETFTVDTTAPTLTVDAPNLTKDNTPTIKGTSNLPAETPVEITIFKNGKPVQTVTAKTTTDGSYTVDLPQALTDGDYTVEAKATDKAGNPVKATDKDGFAIDTTPTSAPTVEIVSDDVVVNNKVIEASEIDTNAQGQKVVNVLVTLPSDAKVGELLVIDGDKSNAITITQDHLSNGYNKEYPLDHFKGGTEKVVTAQVIDAAGNESAVASDSARVEVKLQVSDAPAVTEDDSARLVYDVKLSDTVNGDAVSVKLAIANNSTASASDYVTGFKYQNAQGQWVAVTGNKIELPANAGTVKVAVLVKDDTTTESQERVVLEATTTDARVTTQQDTGVGIINDDLSNGIDGDSSIGKLVVTGGDTVREDDASELVFNVSLSQKATKDVVAKLDLSGTATAGKDYDATYQYLDANGQKQNVPENGQITLPKDGSAVKVFVSVKDDTVTENNETVILTATTTDAHVVGKTAQASGTITDDRGTAPANPNVDEEAFVIKSITSDSVVESGVLKHTVTINKALAEETSVSLKISNQSTSTNDMNNTVKVVFKDAQGNQISGSNLPVSAQGNVEVAAPANTASMIVEVTSKQDTVKEQNESYTISAAIGAQTAKTATGTIKDLDSLDVKEAGIVLKNSNSNEDSVNLDFDSTISNVQVLNPSLIKVNGDVVNWNWSNGALVGRDSSDKKVMTLKVDPTDTNVQDGSKVDVTLHQGIDHASNIDTTKIKLKATTTDGETGFFSVGVTDFTPVAGVTNTSIVAKPSKANITLVIDRSSSMLSRETRDGKTKWEFLQDAINELMNQYTDNTARVYLVEFGTLANGKGKWITPTEVKEYINSTQPYSGGDNVYAAEGYYVRAGETNYDAALIAATKAYDNSGYYAYSGSEAGRVQNVSYFITDGSATLGIKKAGETSLSGTYHLDGNWLSGGRDIGISSYEEKAWQEYLTKNDVVSHALGINVTNNKWADLNSIAYDGVNNQHINGNSGDATKVESAADLQKALLDTIRFVEYSGNVITDGNIKDANGNSVTNSMGGDINGEISKVQYRGRTYNKNINGKIIFNDEFGGKFELDSKNGNYTYTKESVDQAFNINLKLTLVDGDGDKAVRDFNIKVGLTGSESDNGNGSGNNTSTPTIGTNNDDEFNFDLSKAIDGKAGFDTVKFATNKITNLNLSDAANKLDNIELIDMDANDQASASDKITLKLEDVIAVTDSDNDLYIQGDRSDKVQFMGANASWQIKNGTVTKDSVAYQHIASSDGRADVFIEVGVDIF